MLSIRTKLTSSMMVTGMTTVLLAGIAFTVFSVRDRRRDTVSNLTSVADVIGHNCQVALRFDLREDAETMLSALRARPSVVRACIYDEEGNVFAAYPAELLNADWPPCRSGGGERVEHTIADGSLELFDPILMGAGTTVIGVLYLEDDMRKIHAGVRLDATVVAVVLAVALIIAYLVASQLQWLISKPVFALAGTARQISESNDYTVRAVKYSEDELGILTDAFNNMLSQVESGHAEIERSREEYRRLVDNLVGTFLYRHDTKGVFTYVSSSVTHVLGYLPEEFLMNYWTYLTDQPINEQAVASTELSCSGVVQAPFELEIYHKDGAAHWLEVAEVPIRDDAGEVVRVEGIAHDITARKRIELEMEKSEERYRTLFESSGEGIAIAEIAAHRFRYVNPTLCRMLGYEADELIALTVDDIHPTESRERIHAGERELTEGQRDVVQDVPYLRKDGSIVYADMRSSPIVINEIQCIAQFLMDATGRRAAERQKDQLLRAERLSSLGLLAGGVAHDLNNILGPMLVLPSIIEEDLRALDSENGERIRDIEEALGVIEAAGVRAAAVVRDLVVMGRRGQYVLEPVDLSDVECITMDCEHVKELEKMYPNISFDRKLASDALIVSADKEHLSRVACNIIRNAAESIDGQGSISVSTFMKGLNEPYVGYETVPPGEYAVIEIADTGHGIERGHLGRIFEPFFTQKKKSERSGSGLGLAIAHGIVKDHDGFVDVTSAQGEGTRFTLYLPLLDRGVGVEEVLSQEPRPHGTERILVVDDEPSQRYLATRCLQRCGYVMSEVENGHEAVALFEKARQAGEGAPCDLVVLDMIMEQGFDGLTTYREILKLYPQQKAIMASGHAEDDRARAAQDLGADWLIKPYRDEALTSLVRKRLDA